MRRAVDLDLKSTMTESLPRVEVYGAGTSVPCESITRTSVPFWPRRRSPSRRSTRSECDGRTVIWPCTVLCISGLSNAVVNASGRVVPTGIVCRNGV
jgi:hypothetical protein